MHGADVVEFTGPEREFLAAIFAREFRGCVRLLMLLHVLARFKSFLTGRAFKVPNVRVSTKMGEKLAFISVRAEKKGLYSA